MPGFIWGQLGAEAYKQQATGEGTRVSCEKCGETMAASSLRHNMEKAQGIVLPQVRGVYVGGGGLEIYKMSFYWILKSVDCTVEGCLAKAKPREG